MFTAKGQHIHPEVIYKLQPQKLSESLTLKLESSVHTPG